MPTPDYEELALDGAPDQPNESSKASSRFLLAKSVSRRDTAQDRQLLAVAKLIDRLSAKEHTHVLSIDRDSVYGAALCVPQLARSADWPSFLTVLAFRSYFFLLVVCCAQGALLVMMMKEEFVMDLFAGEMHLCDFGASVGSCPGSSACIGPDGTQTTAPRLFSYTAWSTRLFVRDSLKALFPEKSEAIDESVDPGEYGTESRCCRWVCCCIFVLYLWNDFVGCFNILTLLLRVPTGEESWIELKEQEKCHDEHEFGEVRLKVAGMPLRWKVFCFLTVLVPKVLIWKITAQIGVMFLMETAGIQDLVLNCVAMTFIVALDEEIGSMMLSNNTRALLQEVEPMEVFDKGYKVLHDDDSVWKRHMEEQAQWNFQTFVRLVPWKFFCVLVITAYLVFDYYWRNCKWSETGQRFVSKDMFLPASTYISVLNTFFPEWFPVVSEKQSYWAFPDNVSVG